MTQDFGELVVDDSWLNQLDNVIFGHGISLLWWRSGGVKHPHDMPPFRFPPSPTFSDSSEEAQFVYNLTETTDGEAANQLEYCLGRMADMIANDVDEGISRLGIPGGIGAIQANKAREKLNERKIQLIDDFRHGMMGSGRLKKDPLVNVINTQTNSPG